MTRTAASSLLLFGVIGLVVAYVAQLILVSSGGARYEPPALLPLVLLVIAVVVVVVAVPVWRTTRRRVLGPPIDPFYATRVVMLAKSCALTGSLLVGAGVGLLAYLLTRTVPGVGSVITALVALGGAIVLMVGGLVAEHLCTVPPDDRDDHRPGSPEAVEH